MMMVLLAVTMGAVAQENIYGFSVKDAEGQEVSLEKYSGQVMLVVNTATKCGFTPQYKELEELYAKYKDRGFVILDFPCNQFGEQAPGTAQEIHAFCTDKYDIHFPQFDKIDVNGEHAAPLFTYIMSRQGFAGFGKGMKAKMMDMMLKRKDADYAKQSDIKWNFTKFLVNRQGHVTGRFAPQIAPGELRDEIEALL